MRFINPETDDVLYRYELATYSNGLDMFGEPLPRHITKIVLYKYRVLRRTPKGAWIDYFNDRGKRFVLLTARKQYATNTKEEAKQQFIHRTTRYISILQSRLADRIDGLKLIEKVNTND